MNLTLYQLSGCDDYKINKSSYLTQKYLLQGDIKENCDISNPILNIQCPKDAYTNNDFKFNYCYIAEFDRYYFITSITFGFGNIITIGCSVDVLYSFSRSNESWLTSQLYCSRRTNGNRLIQDNLRSFKYDKVVSDITSSIPIPTGTSRRNFAVTGWYDTSYRAVVSCLTTYPFATRDIMQPKGSVASVGDFPSLDENSICERYSTIYYLLTMRSLASLLDQIMDRDDIKSYIKSIVILPYTPDYQDYWMSTTEPPTQQKIQGVFIGDEQGAINLPDYTGFLSYGNYDRFIKEYRDVPSSISFMNYNPYRQLKMFIPYKDYVELDLDSVTGCRLALMYYVNYDDGTADVILYNTTKNKIEYQSQCQLGIKVGISSTNQLEITNQKIQLGVQTAISTIASMVGLMSGNPMIVAGGVMGLVGASANAITKANAMLVTGETAISSGAVGTINPQIVSFIETRQVPTFSDGSGEYTSYCNDKGIPYNEYLTINSLSNDEFAIIDDDNIPLIPRATKNEFNTLKELLKQGIRK